MRAETLQPDHPANEASGPEPTKPGWAHWPAVVMSWTGMLAVGAMLVHVVAEVVARGIFNTPLDGTLEIITYWYLAGIAFIGMWQAFSNGEHISVDLVTARLKPGAQWVLHLFASAIVLTFLALLFYFSLGEALNAMGRGEFIGADRVPIWPMRFIVPIGVGAYMLGLLLQVIKVIRDGHVNSVEEYS